MPSFLTSGNTAALIGARRGWSFKTRARLAADLVLAVRVAEERERAAVGAGGRLDHVRQVSARVGIALLIVEVTQILAAHLHVLTQIEVRAVRDAFELAAAEREVVLDVGAAGGVVRKLLRAVLAQMQISSR